MARKVAHMEVDTEIGTEVSSEECTEASIEEGHKWKQNAMNKSIKVV